MENNKIISGIVVESRFNEKKITADITYKPNNQKKPLILFVHGFKGFKDWGHFPLIADYFAHHGFAFAKMNVSHNGTSPENLVDFVDLEAFGQNNFSIEVSDIRSMIDHFIQDADLPQTEIDSESVLLIGHSRGGSSALITTLEDNRVKACTTWAAVIDIISRYAHPADEEGWKKAGVKYIYNGRTEQNMPLNYQLAEDLINNQERFNIAERLKSVEKPVLLIHGTEDETIPLDDPKSVEGINKNIQTHYISGTHTFDGVHPWTKKELPASSKELCNYTIEFFKSLK